jgi:hypothetical protein
MLGIPRKEIRYAFDGTNHVRVIQMLFDRAAFVTLEARDGEKRFLDAVDAGRIRAALEVVEESRRKVTAHNADLAKHGYSVS